MSENKLTKEEKRLLGIFRAIKEFDLPVLMSEQDTSAAYTALQEVSDLEKIEKKYSEKEISAYLLGFVSGLGATRISDVMEAASAMEDYYAASEEDYEEEEFGQATAPTGGVIKGQGKDPRYVKQTGVRAESST